MGQNCRSILGAVSHEFFVLNRELRKLIKVFDQRQFYSRSLQAF